MASPLGWSSIGTYLFVQVKFWPWKNYELNVLESSLFLLVMLMNKTCTAFMKETNSDDGHSFYIWLLLALIGLEIICFGLLVCWRFLAHKMDPSAEFTTVT